MATKNQHHDNEDDAMFTKKPLGGMSCASCEKNLINIYGKQADYLPWNRFPFRDPAERIAKVISNHSNDYIIGRSRFLKDALYDQPRFLDSLRESC